MIEPGIDSDQNGKNFISSAVLRVRRIILKDKILVENFAFLMILQVVNYVLPLITVPYLVRVLGPEKFGLIAFAQAFVQYFILLTDYGFNFSAPKDISVNRNDKTAVTEIFNTIFVIKTAALGIAFLLLGAIVFSLSKFHADLPIYFITFSGVIGNVLFPVWLFQGMERMKYITYLNLVSRAIFTAAIFIFVVKSDDYLYVPLLTATGSIVSGVLAFGIALKTFGITFRIPKLQSVLRELRSGWNIFLSNIAISLYTTSNVFILGLFTGNTIVGYYSAGEKIIRAAQGLLLPVSQTIYPHISKLAVESRERAITFIQKIAKLVGTATFIISLGLLVFSAQISNLILGPRFHESIPVIRILSFLPFIIGMATVFANFFLLAFGYTRIWSTIIICSSLMSVVGAFFFIYILKLEHVGVSINILLTETSVLLFSFFAFLKVKKTPSVAESGLYPNKNNRST